MNIHINGNKSTVINMNNNGYLLPLHSNIIYLFMSEGVKHQSDLHTLLFHQEQITHPTYHTYLYHCRNKVCDIFL